MNEEDKINELIGMKILSFRKQNNFTRIKLANLLNMSHQQLDKYERGINKISAAKLACIAKKLKININYFYEDMFCTSIKPKNKKEDDNINTILKYFFSIKKSQNRELLLNLAKELSKLK